MRRPAAAVLRVGDAKTKRPAHLATRWALCSGDVLLSHGLSPYYHRGCSVSLPCSEWERVGPLRYCHQKRELMVESHHRPITAHFWRFAFWISKNYQQSTNDYQLAALIR